MVDYTVCQLPLKLVGKGDEMDTQISKTENQFYIVTIVSRYKGTVLVSVQTYIVEKKERQVKK